MTHRLKRARETLKGTRSFVAGVLIGTAFVTPVFAATEITRDDWTTLGLVASIALLAIGLLLRIRVRHGTHGTVPAPDRQDLHDSIGQYRPQIYRP